MKATKTIGVVLGVLLVAALFAGAAAADDSIVYGDTMYFYTLYNGAYTNVELINVDTGDKVGFVAEGTSFYVPGSKELEGTYSFNLNGKKNVVQVKMPTAAVSGNVYKNATTDFGTKPISSLIGKTANTKNAIIITVPASITSNGTTIPVAGVKFLGPNGKNPATGIPDVVVTPNTSVSGYLNYEITDLRNMDLGLWAVQAYFDRDTAGTISKAADAEILGDEYYFTVISADTAKTLVADVDEVLQGGLVSVTVTAPNDNYYIEVEEGVIINGQSYVTVYNASAVDNTNATIYVPAAGKLTFDVKSTSSDNLKVKLYTNTTPRESLKQITVTVKAGAISATAAKDSVYIGDEFDIDGANDLGGTLYFFIKGTNFKLTPYDNGNSTAAGKEWTIKMDTALFKDIDGKKPDAGTYTLYVAKINPKYTSAGYTFADITDTKQFDNSSVIDAYTTISVALVQPFITISVPDVVVQGDKLEVTGTAEGQPIDVMIYVFGTNFFANKTISVLDDGTYELSQKIIATDKDDDINAWKMAAGQYFIVAQHPMYDKVYNVVPLLNADGKTYDIKKNESVGFWGAIIKNPGYNGTILFNTNERQSANAAYALEQAIADENIDDMQAHKSFIVAGPTSYVNAIPAKVTQGEKLTISGYTTGHKDEMVSVELLSTAFAAISKESVGSAAFSTITTRILEDGTWSVTFDTSNMNADDYTVSIAVGQLDPVTGKTSIVAGSTPGPQPTQPGTNPTPGPTTVPTTTPSTPGFGALAALVGLGAVAVLLLRRQ